MSSEMMISHVLILYTGGTIGMRITERGYAPAKGFLQQQLRSMPQFHDPSQARFDDTTVQIGKAYTVQNQRIRALVRLRKHGV